MRRLKGRKPSPALIVAVLALCAALVGTAVAGPVATDSGMSRADVKRVIKIARTLALRFDARFTAPIANNQITKREPDLSVKSAKSADSAKTADSADSAKTAETAANADNAAKLNEIPPSGFLGSNVVLARESSSVVAGARGFANVPCPAGHRVIGGGARFDGFDDDHEVNYNGPAFANQNAVIPGNGTVATAWQASAVNGAESTDTLHVWAICSKLNTP